MRHFIVYILVLLASNTFCQIGQWTKLNNSGTTDHLLSVFVKTSSEVYIAGFNGRIIKTTNAGSSWNLINSGVTGNLYSIKFPTTNIGFAFGDDGSSIKSIDGGNTWQTISVSTVVNFRCSDFPTSSTGYAGGGYSGSGYLFKTIDTGRTWSSVSLPSGIQTIYSVSFTDSLRGCIGTWGGTVYTTINGGVSWVANSFSVNNMSGIYMPSKYNIIAAGHSGKLFTTKNFGNNWTSHFTNTSSFDLGGVSFCDSINGFIVAGSNSSSSSAAILSTTDGGIQWRSYYPPSMILSSVHFYSKNLAFASGLNGEILKYSYTTSNSLADENIKNNIFQIFPNPSSKENVSIVLGEKYSVNSRIDICSIDGKYMNSISILSLSNTIDISTLTKGIYLIKLYSDNKLIEVKRFVKA